MRFLLVAAFLAGCATVGLGPDSRVAALEDEAGYLAGLVKTGKLTKTQAADRLNVKRMQLVGSNPLDDQVFEHYRRLAEQRDANRISAAESQRSMKEKLRQVRARYRERKEAGRPVPDPVFTNFMMKLYGLPRL